MRALAVVSALLLGSLATACAPAAAPDGSVSPPIAAVHRQQCGKCHAPPPPGSHSREEFETAFGRHHKRVHLTQEEWQAMVDYLAPSAN
jgi:Skp family chaperone for outer membrane proteins